MEAQLFMEDTNDYSKENNHQLLTTRHPPSEHSSAPLRPFRDITHKFVAKENPKKKGRGCGNLLKSNLAQPTTLKTLLRA